MNILTVSKTSNLLQQIRHPSFSFFLPSSFSSEASSGLQQRPYLQAGLQPDVLSLRHSAYAP